MNVKNYTLERVREIPEFHSTAYIYRHDVSGARVMYLSNPEDDNKVFSISFCTPPENDCGLPHILEHCTLNGSRKYPVKEPFVELLKGSLNTFLNAMTFPDKTMYPIASRNEKDFMNLMDVYMDAVLYPNLRKDPHIFMQEGWHYELEDKDAELTYKGVVYNEMKGAYSSSESVLGSLIDKAMYPDSCYGKDSGGDPDKIPELTYEEFVAFHKKYYHPANSYIFFYGNGDITKHLTYLDEEYLKDFGDIPADLPAYVTPQGAFCEVKEVEGKYAVGEEEDTEEMTFLTYNVMMDRAATEAESFAMGLIGDLLCQAESAPLKRALLEKGIGQDISCSFAQDYLQPSLRITCKNAEKEQKDEFVKTVREVLQKVAEEGFDEKLLEAAMSIAEFALREDNFGSTPRGLVYNITALNGWMYENDPVKYLGYEEALKSVKEDMTIFTKIVKKILESKNTVIAVLTPEKGLNAKTDEALRQKLKAYKESLSEEEIEILVEKTRDIMEAQQRPDDPENLKKIPLLKREDLEAVTPFKSARWVDIAGRRAGVYNDHTGHIVYLALCFNMDHLPEKYLPYTGILSSCLGMMDTDKYSYQDLDNEIGIQMGAMNSDIRVLKRMDGTFTPYFTIGGKFLMSKKEEALKLVEEIMLRTDLADTERLKEILDEEMNDIREQIEWNGSGIASARCVSYFDPSAAYHEKIGGVDYCLFMKELTSSYDEKKEEVVKTLEEIRDILIRRENLKITMTVDEEDEAAVLQAMEEMTMKLPEGTSPLATGEIVRIIPEDKSEALITSGKVQFVARGGRFTSPFNGALMVLGKILDYEYLWNKVRVQGGAYGVWHRFSRAGHMEMVSYRDPNLKETVEIFDQAGEFLEKFDCDEREMTKYIIGTMSGLDPVRSVSQKGRTALDALETGITGEMLRKLSLEVMETTPEKVRAAAACLKEAMAEPFVCVHGSETKIRENEGMFKNLVRL